MSVGKSIERESESDDEMGFGLFGDEAEEISMVLNYV